MGEAVLIPNGCKRGDVAGDGRKVKPGGEAEGQSQLLALVLAAIRKSVVPCRMEADADEPSAAAAGWRAAGMEIGWPTDVRHVAHVTFDRLQGFLGLPVEFELEMPCQVPSASASVFGVSAESMQCGYDANGNSVPKILLLMQERLYAQGGLKAEGIFRITPENSQEARVREQLNKGIVPDDIDVHCLASLVKAWFRELPEGVLDSLSPEQVLQCNTEEECIELVKLLPPTEAALLNWIVELMADVVEEEEANKMNARNIAMVFAPNMTQMSDPLTALMHAVQVMNLLKTLILKTLRERKDEAGSYSSFSSPSSSDQLDDDNENENYVDGDYESLKGIDKASELRAASERHSQHELPLIGASRRHSSIDCHLPYASYSSDDEDELLNDIEECFLRRLEEGKESSEGLEKDGSNNVSPNKEAKQLNFSECKNGSCKTGNEMRTLKDVKDEASNEPETIGSRISIKKTDLSSVMKEGLSFCS